MKVIKCYWLAMKVIGWTVAGRCNTKKFFGMTKQSWRICIQSYARHHPDFANKEKRLVTISSQPDFKILVWAWDKTKVIVAQTLSMHAEIRQVSFSPDDASTIVVTGRDFYRYFKL